MGIGINAAWSIARTLVVITVFARFVTLNLSVYRACLMWPPGSMLDLPYMFLEEWNRRTRKEPVGNLVCQENRNRELRQKCARSQKYVKEVFSSMLFYFSEDRHIPAGTC